MSAVTAGIGRAARGAAAGTLAAGVMGGVFLAARRFGIVAKVAPEHITEAAIDAAGATAPEPVDNAMATVSHLAYGAANGALYALARLHLPGGPLAGGVGFASALMLASYEGWVPAAGILPPLHEQTTGGRWTLVAGHAVYGAVLGRLAA
jgi:hypothetical protein